MELTHWESGLKYFTKLPEGSGAIVKMWSNPFGLMVEAENGKYFVDGDGTIIELTTTWISVLSLDPQ